MQVKTERRLGFIAALGLTIAVFIMPTISTHMTHDINRKNLHITAMLTKSTVLYKHP